MILVTKHSEVEVNVDMMIIHALVHDAFQYTPPGKRKWTEHCAIVDLTRALDEAQKLEVMAVQAIADKRVADAIEQDK